MRALFVTVMITLLAVLAVPAQLPEIDTTDIVEEPTTPAQTMRWVSLTLNRPYPERRDPYNFFDPVMENFRDLQVQIAEARDDEHVHGMVLKIDVPAMGWSRMQSLRRELLAFRAEDKQVIAYLEQATPGAYLLATACDEIVMAEEGLLLMTGLNLEGIFLRGLLDKLHIEPQIIQMGQYKGAGDMFTQTGFTPPMREAYTAIVDDLWGQMVDEIATGRDMEPAEIEALIDRGPFTADAALEAGLVDQLANPSDFVRALEISVGDGFLLDRDYDKVEYGEEQMSLMTLFSRMQPGMPSAAEANAPKIALLYATGPIMAGGRNPDDPFQDPNVVLSSDFIRTIHEARDDETVKAVVVRVDSPGGSALGSDQIWAELRALRDVKPVVVSMGDTAASGGYYIAMAGDEIFAEPGTITGSIGVIGGKMVLGQMLEQHLGITHDSISRGANARMFSPMTPFSDSERAAITLLMEDTYEAFTSKAAECRGMTAEEIEAVAQGRIWTGNLALEAGLIDHLGGLNDALERAQELAGLSAQEREALIVVELPAPLNLMAAIMQMITGGGATVAMPNVLSGILTEEELTAVNQVTMWRQLFEGEMALVLMPVNLSVR